jgi:cytochrome c-type biogenesis protein
VSGLVVGVGLYGAGVSASLSPCVLPLVPGWLAVVVDSAGGASRWLRVSAFCVGAVLTFAIFGSVVAGLGTVAVASDGVQRIAGAALIVAAIAAEASRRGRLPHTWQLAPTLPRSPLPRAAVLGIACGAAWTPCVGPLLGAALTAAGSGGSVARGAMLLTLFGAGVVTPMVVLAALPAPRLPRMWRQIGVHLQRGVPVVLAVLGVLLLTGSYVPFVQRLSIAT